MIGFLSIFWRAGVRLVYDGGLANSASVALSLLFSLFPFMILIAVLADIWGDPALLEQILLIVFEGWPADAARPVAEQMKVVLGQASGKLFTLSNLFVLILATNGIESARDGLNRAYKFQENRNFFLRRLQGTAFVLTGAIALILSALILVATPVVWQFLIARLSWLEPFAFTVGLVQYGIAASLLLLTLLGFHIFLPASKMRIADVIWGVVVTILGIFIGSRLFAIYLKSFADYANLYAGLAGIMIVIVYLYCLSILILFGAEVNAEIKSRRDMEHNTDNRRSD